MAFDYQREELLPLFPRLSSTLKRRYSTKTPVVAQIATRNPTTTRMIIRRANLDLTTLATLLRLTPTFTIRLVVGTTRQEFEPQEQSRRRGLTIIPKRPRLALIRHTNPKPRLTSVILIKTESGIVVRPVVADVSATDLVAVIDDLDGHDVTLEDVVGHLGVYSDATLDLDDGDEEEEEGCDLDVD
ncbi:hypothetical protein PQX77_018548 [Marasmius sp. AFHP31]|nr:hypothetical protein PQX77_018548 [Marasmius sp. AFHP31]